MSPTFVEINNALKVLAKNAEDIAQLETDVTFLKTIINSQQKKLDEYEDRSRRRDFIIFGLPEADGENRSQLKEQVVNEMVSTKLGVTAKAGERIHKLSRKKKQKKERRLY